MVGGVLLYCTRKEDARLATILARHQCPLQQAVSILSRHRGSILSIVRTICKAMNCKFMLTPDIG